MSLDDDQALVNKILHASTNNEDILSDREIKRGQELLSGLEDDLHKLNTNKTEAKIGSRNFSLHLHHIGASPERYSPKFSPFPLRRIRTVSSPYQLRLTTCFGCSAEYALDGGSCLAASTASGAVLLLTWAWHAVVKI